MGTAYTSSPRSADGNKTAPSFAEFGLHCLRHPASDTCVVFVHGILSSGETAWGSPSWPELLKAEPQLKHIGIFVFTYRTSFASRTYSIADAADALREHFSIDGLWSVPNIVFVCHSMGGIVVRRFLVANQAKLSDLHPAIGLFLVASPSLGSRDGNLLSALSFALQHTQAAALRFSQANTSLDELHRDFRTLLNGRKLCIVGRELLEDRPIKVKRWLGLWRQVVEPFSASAYFHQPGCEPLRIPGSDHMTIVKPAQPTALQHVALKRFLSEFPKIAQASCEGRLAALDSQRDKEGTQAPRSGSITNVDIDSQPTSPAPGKAATLDRIARAAIAPERQASIELPSDGATAREVYQTAVKLRAGRMLERILSSTMVRRHQDPLAVFMSALDDQNAKQREFESMAAWLRFLPDCHNVEPIADSVCKKLNLSDVYATRMRAEITGWAGSTMLPAVNWDDRWCKEKFSWCFAKASLHAAWRDQGEHDLRFLSRQCIDRNADYKSYYNRDIHFFDFMSAVKGIPASNSKVLLNEMINNQAPTAMMSALLYRMCTTPTTDAMPELGQLARHADQEVAHAARTALAFIPARSEALREMKRSILLTRSAPFAAAAGVDLRTDAIDELGAMLASGVSGEAAYNAAWALVRMVKLSREADRYVKESASENTDKIVRSICLIGQAIEHPRGAEAQIADEYASARDVEKFCLSIALAYTSDAREMLSVLANTGEDRLYVPYLNTCFKLLFLDAMKHAATKSPILGEMLLLTDDT
jgi:pimeloyl-ACP methyl ester carboxylesterase